jgi:hypothetical protein
MRLMLVSAAESLARFNTTARIGSTGYDERIAGFLRDRRLQSTMQCDCAARAKMSIPDGSCGISGHPSSIS